MGMETQTEDQTDDAIEPATLNIPETEPANDTTPDIDVVANDNATPDDRRPTRKERKDTRFRDAQVAARDAERRLASYEDERRKQATELAEMRGRLTAYEQRQQQRPAPDNHEANVQAAHREALAKLKAAASAGDPAASEAAMMEYHAALTRAARLEASRETRQQIEAMRKSMPDPQTTGMATTLAQEFDWLPTNGAARQMADGYVGWLINTKGRQPGLATYREACAMAAKEFGLGGSVERPSEARRAAYNGISGREAAGSSDEDETRLRVPQSDIPKLKLLAHARFPELEPDAAFGKWLKENGSKLKK